MSCSVFEEIRENEVNQEGRGGGDSQFARRGDVHIVIPGRDHEIGNDASPHETGLLHGPEETSMETAVRFVGVLGEENPLSVPEEGGPEPQERTPCNQKTWFDIAEQNPT